MIACIHGSIAPLGELQVSLLVWHWTCVQLPCAQLLHLHFYSLLLMPLWFTAVFGNSLWEVTVLHKCVKSHIGVLKLMSWNRATPNTKGWSDPQGWAKSSPSLTDKEMLAWKEGQFSEMAQNPLSGWQFSLFFLTSPYYLNLIPTAILMPQLFVHDNYTAKVRPRTVEWKAAYLQSMYRKTPADLMTHGLILC